MKPRKHTNGGAIVEPNMTPLIDVSLVLVVILMVATPLAFQSSIGVRPAASSGQKALESARTERVELSVLSDSTVRVNNTVVAASLLGPTLDRVISASATRVVIVRCADDVPHAAFVHALDEAKLHGASQIAVREK